MCKINELIPGQIITSFFLLKGLQEKQTKTGKAYLDLNFADNTGNINAKLWDYNKSVHKFNTGDILKVQAKVSEYQGQKQLSIEKIRKAEDTDNVSVSEFYRISERNFDEMKTELLETINSIKNKYLKELLQIIFSGNRLVKFMNVPAGKAWHHAYIGGLLEHTLEIIKICDLMCNIHPNVIEI